MSLNVVIPPCTILNATEFRVKQGRLNWSNKQLAMWFGVSDQTISNWRHGRQAIPPYVSRLYDFAGLATKTDLEISEDFYPLPDKLTF